VRAEAPIAESQIAARNPPWMIPAGLQKRSSDEALQVVEPGTDLSTQTIPRLRSQLGGTCIGAFTLETVSPQAGRHSYREPMSAGDTIRTVSARSVITGVGSPAPGRVEMIGATITAVGPLGSTEPEFDVLAPGFVDLQVNGIGETDVAVADGGDRGDRDSDWTKLGRALLAQGVTTWCPTLVTAPAAETQAAVGKIAEARMESAPGMPAIAGVHLEGPYITLLGAHRPEYAVDRVPEGWAASLDPEVRVVTLAPEVPGAIEAIAELSRRGVLVSLGHSGCSAEQAHEAATAGARLVTHLGNATGPFHQRSPGLLGAALTDDRLSVSLIADLEHVHADLLRLAFKSKGASGVVLVTDSVAVRAGTVGPVAIAGHEPGRAARLADGTLAGSALTMHQAISNVVSAAGISLEDAVTAASTTPARLLGLADRGAIAPGMRADLVAFSRDDHSVAVEGVWASGVRSVSRR
jgi:N-acetylglucosamine-6-phosphate deacetylase